MGKYVYCGYVSRHTFPIVQPLLHLALRRLTREYQDDPYNFVGANIKLRKAFTEINHTKTNNFLKEELGGEWITWRRNAPMVKNIGRVWERQIRSARNKLKLMLRINSLLKTHGESLNDESLRSLLLEVKGFRILSQ